jgi:hypothetical protein
MLPIHYVAPIRHTTAQTQVIKCYQKRSTKQIYGNRKWHRHATHGTDECTTKSSNSFLQETLRQDAAQWQNAEANLPYDKITRKLTHKFLVNGNFNVEMSTNAIAERLRWAYGNKDQKRTNTMVHSPSWKADSLSAAQ